MGDGRWGMGDGGWGMGMEDERGEGYLHPSSKFQPERSHQVSTQMNLSPRCHPILRLK